VVTLVLYCFICRGSNKPKPRPSQISITKLLHPIMAKWRSRNESSYASSSKVLGKQPRSVAKLKTDRTASSDSLAPRKEGSGITEDYSYMTIHGDTLTQIIPPGSLHSSRVLDGRYSRYNTLTTLTPTTPMGNTRSSQQSTLTTPKLGSGGSSKQKPPIAGGSNSLPMLTPKSSTSSFLSGTLTVKPSANRKSSDLLPVFGYRNKHDSTRIRQGGSDASLAARRRVKDSDNSVILSLGNVSTTSYDPDRGDSKVLMKRPKWNNSESGSKNRRAQPIRQLIKRLGDLSVSDRESGLRAEQGNNQKGAKGDKVGTRKINQRSNIDNLEALGSKNIYGSESKPGIRGSTADSISVYDTKDCFESNDFDL